MTTNAREYPEISFVDTDTETLINALIQSYEMFTGRTLYPADPARLFILWIADIIVQERVGIDFSAKQNLPRYAQGEYLDSVAELFRDVYRLEPEKAHTVLRFTLSTLRDVPTIIPQGTRATVDGDIVFETLESLTIPTGGTTGDVAAECMTTGTDGNGFVPGQINRLVDIFPYYGSVANATESAGGADEESDDAFYQRMRESQETFSTTGTLGAYEYYAKSASAQITDVKADSPSPGVVDVRILLQGGVLPGEEIINTVTDMLTNQKLKVLTDNVIVSAPEKITYDIDFTYYTLNGGPLPAESVAQNVADAVKQFKEWQAGKLGRDIDPSELNFLIKKAGVKRVEIRSPIFTVVDEKSVAEIGNTTIVDGGAESE